MFEIYRKDIAWGGRTLTLETGKIARQADGAVMATYGETTVLATVVSQKDARADVDFFPLAVHYQERTFAAGKIPGGFFKREGRPTEKETLTSRLIDRPIRPLFAEGFKNDTQIVCTVMSHDLENDPDIVAMVATSAALTLSGIPFLGPIGGVRVGYVGDAYVLNPTAEQLEQSQLDLVVAGTQDGVLMVESEASELPEETMLGAVMWGHEQMKPVIDGIIELAETCAKEPWPLPEPDHNKAKLDERVRAVSEAELRRVYGIQDKQERSQGLQQARTQAQETLAEEGWEPGQVKEAFKALEKDIVRNQILETGKRIDDRALNDIRPVACEVGLLPRAHGSALFTRGETQAFAVATLGTTSDEQFVDALEGEYRERFMVHYNFPPYSTGETGRVGFTSRREIGHGKLAWRGVHPLLPSKDDFPYTLRVVSEITESNGSSSMATVCGTSLSLMDAGVPLPRPVGGIAMGLVKEDERVAVLSDILGDEDALGDMDFKVAGTEEGVTALQMDIKITSITQAIMRQALDQAREGRLHIIGEMKNAISTPREDVSSHAPRMSVIQIPKDKIRDVIGPGGKTVREIVDATGAKVDIEDDGTVRIAAVEQDAANAAIDRVRSIVAEPETGAIYNGSVVKVVEFGAFVNFLGNRDGLVHISEMAEERVRRVSDILDVGDKIKVKCLGFDDRGRVKLSMRQVDQETGEDLTGGKQAS